MAMWTNIVIAAAVCTYAVTVVTSRETYGELCKVYDLNEPLDDLAEGTGRECKISDNYEYVNREIQERKEQKRYCKTYPCPSVSCATPTRGSDGCQRCDGQECQWGGKIYPPGEGGLCVDGCNRCSCGSYDGGIAFSQTLMGCSDGYFCFNRKN